VSGPVKLVAIIFILLLGLDFHGRWTGESYQFNLFGKNAIGDVVKSAGG
jgi:hypothetical protein